VSQDINVVALIKGEEKYIFLFDDKNRAETLRTLGRYASNPELSFSWYDAAVLSQKIRKIENHSVDAKVCARADISLSSDSPITDGFNADDYIF
jgi:hypothetical protein